MPEVNDPKKDPDKKRYFITEKVVKQPMTRKQIAMRAAVFLLLAVVFGIVAAVSFTVARPLADRYLGTQQPQEPSISIPKDEPEAVAPTEGPGEAPAEQESAPIEEMVKNAVERYRFNVEDLNALFASLRSQVQKAGKSIVTVHSVQQNTDWFDNPVETTGLYAGAVIASTRQEYLIMTPEAAVEGADSILVTLSDGTEVSGRMKQLDRTSGMAIVSVSAEELGDNAQNIIEVLSLGNSYMVHEGDLIVAVGSPAGIVHSVDYGFVSYVMKNVQMVDQMNRVIYSGIHGDAERGTFLLNTSGELIGWVMEPGQGSDGSGMAEIMGISDYKGILEKLTNGLGAPCVGIRGQEVSEAMAGRGLPDGIYVMNSVADGAAYNAGIQNGDVITRINDREIKTMKEYQSVVDSLECGQLIHVTVERDGRDQFTELEFQVTVGAR